LRRTEIAPWALNLSGTKIDRFPIPMSSNIFLVLSDVDIPSLEFVLIDDQTTMFTYQKIRIMLTSVRYQGKKRTLFEQLGVILIDA
jgi:hypothetical protein